MLDDDRLVSTLTVGELRELLTESVPKVVPTGTEEPHDEFWDAVSEEYGNHRQALYASFRAHVAKGEMPPKKLRKEIGLAQYTPVDAQIAALLGLPEAEFPRERTRYWHEIESRLKDRSVPTGTEVVPSES